jgi:DNA-binding Lrp family transcriptional regulator
MEPTDLPDEKRTKKERIRELVKKHPEYLAEEIANRVGTTKENVWKEKSKMGSEGLIVRRRTSTKITAERKDDTVLLLSSTTDSGGESVSRLKNTAQSTPALKTSSSSDEDRYLRHLNISPVDNEGMKSMYQEFKKGTKSVDIIAKHGYPPAVVEVEYQRFLKLQATDIQELQTFIGNHLVKYPLVGLGALEQKYKETGSLTIEEMNEVVKGINKFNCTTNPPADQNII